MLQHKTRLSLLDLLESHVGGNVLETAIQTKSPTPTFAQVPHPDPAYKKRKWDYKGKEVVEERKDLPSKEAEP